MGTLPVYQITLALAARGKNIFVVFPTVTTALMCYPDQGLIERGSPLVFLVC